MNSPPTPAATPTSGAGWYAKRRYHHGDLRESALERGRQIVASQGPTALTLRGLARELGVTAPALVYYFGSLAGLRAAVAATVLERLESACSVTQAQSASRRSPQDIGTDWIAFAASNANLYRLATGEGWHHQPAKPDGLNGGALIVPSPRRALEDALLRQVRRDRRSDAEVERARYLSSAIHGLALARLDGVSPAVVARALDRSTAAAA